MEITPVENLGDLLDRAACEHGQRDAVVFQRRRQGNVWAEREGAR